MNQISNEIKNQLSIDDLDYSVKDLLKRAEKDDQGRYVFKFFDEGQSEEYIIRLRSTTRGFDCHGTLNGAIAYQLNGEFFSENTFICFIFLMIAGLSREKALETEFREFFKQETK